MSYMDVLVFSFVWYLFSDLCLIVWRRGGESEKEKKKKEKKKRPPPKKKVKKKRKKRRKKRHPPPPPKKKKGNENGGEQREMRLSKTTKQKGGGGGGMYRTTKEKPAVLCSWCVCIIFWYGVYTVAELFSTPVTTWVDNVLTLIWLAQSTGIIYSTWYDLRSRQE